MRLETLKTSLAFKTPTTPWGAGRAGVDPCILRAPLPQDAINHYCV